MTCYGQIEWETHDENFVLEFIGDKLYAGNGTLLKIFEINKNKCSL